MEFCAFPFFFLQSGVNYLFLNFLENDLFDVSH